MAAWLGPAIAGAFQMGSSIYNQIAGKNQARDNINRTHKHNLELAEYGYSKDLEMWNRMNQYNTPSMQMERLKKAGLNPKLVYGTGSVTGNTSGQMPKYNAPQMDYRGIPAIQIPSMISAFQDISLKSAQIDNVKAQTSNTEVRTLLEKVAADIASSTKGSEISRKKLQLGLSRQKHQMNIEDIELKRLGQKKMRRELTEKDYDIIFKKYRNQWMKNGVTTSDSVVFRVLVRMMENAGINLMDLNNGL